MSGEKTLEELAGELKNCDSNCSQIVGSIDQLEGIVNEVNRAIELPSVLRIGQTADSFLSTPIKDWTKANIKRWSVISRSTDSRLICSQPHLTELFAVIKRAVFLFEWFSLRDIQILSVLILLFKPKEAGRLAQIYTGEGKSTTVAVLAIVQVFQGKQVDIVTSSDVLAQRDSKEKSELFDYFNMTCAENCSDFNSGPKSCYRKDIVYGDTLNFQGDILCHEYRLLGTRCKRRHDVVIVDEVDSMLIDERLRKTMLSTRIPGMMVLTPVLEFVWSTVNKLTRHLINGAGADIPKMNLEYLVKIHLNAEVKRFQNYAESSVPTYLKEYASNQILNWCTNAVTALLIYKRDEQYCVREDQIVPISYQSNGVLQYNMHWGEGLHQFLQMKEDLPVDPINLTTNFMSNVSFFKRYGTNIFGLTGTLGSNSERDLLANLYQLDTVYIPPYKTRRLVELDGFVFNGYKPWLDAVTSNILEVSAKGRAVLVICETIHKVDIIHGALNRRVKDTARELSISRYVEGSAADIALAKLQPGQIVLATNLAGRGTDLKLSTGVLAAGGLHVSVTFLPENVRVEEQAFGRAGRQGDPGTAQIFVNLNDKSIRGI